MIVLYFAICLSVGFVLGYFQGCVVHHKIREATNALLMLKQDIYRADVQVKMLVDDVLTQYVKDHHKRAVEASEALMKAYDEGLEDGKKHVE